MPVTAGSAAVSDLTALVGAEGLVAGADAARYTSDASVGRGLRGAADAVVLPPGTDEVAAVVGWCCDRGVPVTPRGGGSGLAGGAVPDGGVVLGLERMRSIRSFDPGLWRIHTEAGVTTSELRRRARESGLMFPPDPGAAEQSQIGGNVATNAGGPHAFKYGVTGAWVTGLEVVVPPGRVLTLGGPTRKDVSTLDLGALFVGSEGTLGVITSVWLRLLPAPETEVQAVGFYSSVAAGCAAVESVLASGVVPAAIEFVEGIALDASRGAFPGGVPADARFAVLAEVDGDAEGAARQLRELVEALSQDPVAVVAFSEHPASRTLWRWREAIPLAVTARRGAKLSEDVVVPVDRLADAVEGTLEIGARHALDACSWGHAGDGNLHATFLAAPGTDELDRAATAATELFELASSLEGTLSGEHGVGSLKRRDAARHVDAVLQELQTAVKRSFDPSNVMNPERKLP